MTMFFNENAIKNKIQTYKQSFFRFIDSIKPGAEDVKTQNRKADEASRQSFPASDPPGHMSKSYEDRSGHKH